MLGSHRIEAGAGKDIGLLHYAKPFERGNSHDGASGATDRAGRAAGLEALKNRYKMAASEAVMEHVHERN